MHKWCRIDIGFVDCVVRQLPIGVLQNCFDLNFTRGASFYFLATMFNVVVRSYYIMDRGIVELNRRFFCSSSKSLSLEKSQKGEF